MKFICATEVFAKAVGVASVSVPTSGATELAAAILLKAEGEKLEISAISMDTNTSVSIAADITEGGAIMLPAHVFADMIKRFSGDVIEFESTEGHLVTMKSGRTKCEIAGADPREFPDAPEVKPEGEIRIAEKTFSDMIRGTSFAASTNEQRPTIMGCLLEKMENAIRMVAIDGYRIAIVEYAADGGGDAAKVNIPANALREWAKISDGSDDEIVIRLGAKNVIIEKNSPEMEIKFTARVINGDFMDWQKFIPPEFSSEIVLEKSDLVRAIERVSTVLTATQKAPVKITFGKGGANFFCETTLGKATDDIEKKTNLAECIMGFNNRFLYDAVKNADSDEIKLQWNGPTDAMLLSNPVEG
ncbi:MAG: DNA polymerase III subunit beta, partial [Oscillospiraceae bacterium]|nr:DNA polymerase III subunit beta [Oscillospiraceae bacterium]